MKLPMALAKHMLHFRKWAKTVVDESGIPDDTPHGPICDIPFLIVETHSEYILRGTLRAVSDGIADPSDVMLLMVSADTYGNPYVTPIPPSANGEFEVPWPTEFFPDPREL